jgi:transposase
VPSPEALKVTIPIADRAELERRERSETIPSRDKDRAKMILLAAEDKSNSEIARELKTNRNRVAKWRKRYIENGLDGLKDLQRSGKPPSIPVEAFYHSVSIACEPPLEDHRTEHNLGTIIEKLVEISPEYTMSQSHLSRFFDYIDLKPWKYRSWMTSPDPQFEEKLEDILWCYHECPKDEIVLCIDEKPGIQVKHGMAENVPAIPGHRAHEEFEYERNGTRNLFAAFNIRTGEVVAEVTLRRTAEDLLWFMEIVAETYPDQTVHIVWDNLNTHYDGKDGRWTRFNQVHSGRFRFHYTPKRASWLNQVELWFSILTRRVIRHGNFGIPCELEYELMGFVKHWNHNEAHPFNWTYRGQPLRVGRKH